MLRVFVTIGFIVVIGYCLMLESKALMYAYTAYVLYRLWSTWEAFKKPENAIKRLMDVRDEGRRKSGLESKYDANRHILQ